MMKFRLVADNPEAEEMVIDEKSWRPARSLMAIAARKMQEREGFEVVPFETLGDLDDNAGYGIEDGEVCRQLAEEMEAVLQDPFAICDYGMTTDVDGDGLAYTYPTNLCTAYFEDANTGDFFENLQSDGIVGRRVRSWFRITEEEMQKVIGFIKNSGGFAMP